MIYTAGVDVGTGAVKCVIFEIDGGKETMLAKTLLRIRQRDPNQLAREAFEHLLEETGLKEEDMAYVATTGEGESLAFAHRSLLFHDHPRPRRDFPRSGLPRVPGCRRAARPGHLRSTSAARCCRLQDDQPMRLGFRPVPGEHRPLPRHRPGRDRRTLATGGRPRNGSAASAPSSRRPTSSTWSRAA